jgi:predicted ester cyclase
MRRWMGSAASGDLASLDRHFAKDFRPESTPPGLSANLETATMAHRMSMQAFPDREVEIPDIFEEGDRASVHCRATGTNRGGLPWLGIPVNGRSVDFQWIGIYTLKGGRIVGHTAINDAVGLLVQLGAMEPPGLPRA